jgi:hypothetical protein
MDMMDKSKPAMDDMQGKDPMATMQECMAKMEEEMAKMKAAMAEMMGGEGSEMGMSPEQAFSQGFSRDDAKRSY